MKKSGQFLTASLAVLCLLASAGMAAAAKQAVCIAPNNGKGTADMPPIACEYVGPAEYHWLKDQVTGKDLILLNLRHGIFEKITVTPGGIFDGEIEIFESRAMIEAIGVGPLEGFHRFFSVPLDAETHIGKREFGKPVQDFDTQMYRLEGGITGDKDFKVFEITAGEAFGLSSPGHTTLTYQEESDSYWVDSFFDVKYQIDYVGASGGKLEGYEGTSQDVLTVTAVAATE